MLLPSRRARVVCVAFVIRALSAHEASASVGETTDNESDVAAIVRAWERHEGRIMTIDVSWDGVEFQAAELIQAMRERFRRVTDGVDDVYDGADITQPSHSRLVVDLHPDAVRLRYDREGHLWSKSTTDGSYVASKLHETFGDHGRVCFFPTGNVGFPNAHITGEPVRAAGHRLQVIPILMVCCPLHPQLGVIDPRNGSLRGDGKAMIESRQCVVLEQRWSKNGGHIEAQRLYCDIGRDYMPLRYENTFDHRLVSSITVDSVAADEVLGWLPREWTLVVKTDGDGRPLWTESVTVGEYEINAQVDPSTFQIEFPAGTWVSDYTTGERYIVEDDGRKRPVLPGEFTGDNYDEIVSTAPGQAGRSLVRGEGVSWRRWILPATILVCLMCAALLVWERGRHG